MIKTRQHSFSFEGKVALVTGGSAGIGRATALAFGAAGAVVVIADTNVDGGHASAAMIVEQGGKALFVRSDVTRAQDVEALVDKAVSTYGRLDFAFNNAGIEDEPGALSESEEEAFDRIMALNVKGTWLCMKYQLRKMLRQEGGGAIVNSASAMALVGAPGQALVAASKHAVVGMTRSAALEYAGAGIRINSVCPGTVRTPSMARALERDPQRAQELLKRHPAGRFAETRDVANAVLWLCSEHASFVTGHQLAIDGGLTAI
jgi:NAD(P)-dependent dehydrogenase (short-subunit alcohol dehydrogenase family)